MQSVTVCLSVTVGEWKVVREREELLNRGRFMTVENVWLLVEGIDREKEAAQLRVYLNAVSRCVSFITMWLLIIILLYNIREDLSVLSLYILKR